MNKRENSFNKSEQDCYCSSNRGLFVPNRHLSFIVAGLLFLSFFLFMTGYFLGKKKIAEDFSENIQKEACADHIYTSVLAADNLEQCSSKDVTIVCSADINSNESSQSVMNHNVVIDQSLENNVERNADKDVSYYAELIGFVTENAAQMFVKKLAAKGIGAEIKKRISKTVKGRTSYWYQVVTATYSNKNDLVELVNKIVKEENIKDTNIRMC